MFIKKTFTAVLAAMIFISSTAPIQGYAPLYNENAKAQITVSSSNSTIKNTSKKIVLDHYEIILAPGQTIQINAKIESAAKGTVDNTKLVWKSDKAASVQVNGQGAIKAIKPNSKAVITVSSADKKLKASCKVTVMSEQEALGCVALINNIKVTNHEYMVFSKFYMNQFLASNAYNETADKYNWTTKINGQTAKNIVKKQTLDNIQELKIQLKKAMGAGIKLDAKDLKSIDDYFNQLIAAYGNKDSAEQEIKAAYGISLKEYKKVYSDIVLSQKYISSEFSKIKISDSEVKKYYDNHKKDYAKVTVTHILISTVDNNGMPVSEDKKAEAKKKADELLVRINTGEDIKVLAVENSDDKPAVDTNKGEYTFGKGEMVAEFEEWAFSHSVGDTGIVETTYGFHVMKLDAHVETAFDVVKESIKDSLVGTKFNEAFTKKMDSWKKESQFKIQINNKTMEKIDRTLYRA